MADKKKVSTAEQMYISKNLTVGGTITAADIVVTDDQTLTDDLTVSGTINANGGLVTDTIAEETAAAGVTVDGLLIKDGALGAQQVITGDGAITIANGATVFLTKGSAAAITLAAPTAGQNHWRITVIAGSAQAHVVTQGTVGFNAKGSSGTATFTATIGNSFTVEAYNGNWYNVANNGVTYA